MEKKKFGNTQDGKEIYLYTFTSRRGIEMTLSDLGAVLVSLKIPDCNGKKRDVVLGYDNAEAYANNTNTYFGATIGRNANRMEGASFTISGKEYKLTQNEGRNNLHSGPAGYQLRLWKTEIMADEENGITFLLESPSGDQGYPGCLNLKVSYILTEKDEVRIIYQALSDADTIFNPTNHSYFNLDGHGSGPITEHTLRINAESFTPVRDQTSIPTGIIEPVAGTPMDFRETKKIGRDIEDNFDQLIFTGGYDHNYVLANEKGRLCLAAEAAGAESGISMCVYTDLPGIQFYAGNFINQEKGKDGAVYNKRDGFCLETQYFPNAVNTPQFSSPIIRAGNEYMTETIYRFGW